MKLNLRILLFAATFFSLICHHAGAIEVGGEITTDTVWTKNMSPYVITDTVTILEDVMLTIESGTFVEFKKVGSSEGSELIVEGTLQALGEEGDPVIFTIDDKEYFWGHIEFTETSTAWDEAAQTGCILQFCILEYGGNGTVDDPEQATVRVESGSPCIRNNVIRYGNNDGIRTVSGTQNITGNRIHDTAAAIRIIAPDKALVAHNFLINNTKGIYVESGMDAVQVSENTVIALSSEGYGSNLDLHMLSHDNLTAYLWEQIAGPEVDLDDETAVSPVFTVPDVTQNETLSFQLTVTDVEGMMAVDTVDVNVTWENVAPTADAGTDEELIQGDLVTLDGTNSFDGDGGTLTYNWVQTSGTDVTAGWSQDPQGQYRSFYAPAPASGDWENLVFQLTVTDNNGAVGFDSVVIRVKSPDADNMAPVADPGDVQTGVEGSKIDLNGGGSYDPDGSLVSYLWKQTEGDYVELTNPATPTPSFTAPEVEAEGATFTFELTVTDDDLEEASKTVIVNVIDDDAADPNHPPVAIAETEAGEDVVEEGQTNVTLIGSNSSDPDSGDSVSSYAWKQLSGPSVVLYGTGSERTFTAPNVTENQQLVFRLTVLDVDGLRSTDTVAVTVNWVNVGPTADAGSDQTVDEGIMVQLDGSGSSDADDGISSYEWTQVGGVPVNLLDADAPKAIFTAPDVIADETLVFLLTVKDASGEADYENVHVTITADNSGPVADAGIDRIVAFAQADVSLDGSASSDPDGAIVSYLWEQVGEENVTLYNATTATPHFTAPTTDILDSEEEFISLIFQLTVADDDGLTDVDTVLVNVTNNPAATVPVANAGDLQTVSVGAEVTLDASNSFDPDLNPELIVRDNRFTHLFIDAFNPDPDAPLGNIVGLTRDTDANSILIFNGNNIENIDANYSLFVYNWADDNLDEVDMDGNWWGTDVDGQIDGLIYDVDFDGTLPAVNYQPALAAAADGAGSNLVYPPIALDRAGEDRNADPDDEVTLSCPDVYDPDQLLTYHWAQTGGAEVVLENPDAAETTFIVPAYPDEDDADIDVDEMKALTFLLTISDPYGYADTDEVVITINAPDEEKADEGGGNGSSGCFISTIGN